MPSYEVTVEGGDLGAAMAALDQIAEGPTLGPRRGQFDEGSWRVVEDGTARAVIAAEGFEEARERARGVLPEGCRITDIYRRLYGEPPTATVSQIRAAGEVLATATREEQSLPVHLGFDRRGRLRVEIGCFHTWAIGPDGKVWVLYHGEGGRARWRRFK